jgi:glyoxylase-like metal-dependent hydrolase (beta-lactamase superfamily II)
MRAVALGRDAIVVTSSIWQLNAVALRSGDEAVLIDSPYFPDELDMLPALLEQSGFSPSGLLATHADYDHVLGRLAFPGMALGVGEMTGERLRRDPGAVQRALRDADARHYVARAAPLALGQVQELPVPGKIELGEEELEAHPAEGHTADGTAYFARFAGVLAVGDYLSDVEIPMISPGGALDDYRATLARLAPLIEAAEHVVPGHGAVHDRDTALRILGEDGDYLDALERGEAKLPKGRDSAEHRFHNQRVGELGAHLLGRRLYEEMTYWETADQAPDAGETELEFARIWQSLPKIVFSSTLEAVEGNTTLATAGVAEEVARLKEEEGGDIGVGGAGLASTCIELGLVDEYLIFVSPVVLGGGTPFFPALKTPIDLELVETRTFASRVVYLRYRAHA